MQLGPRAETIRPARHDAARSRFYTIARWERQRLIRRRSKLSRPVDASRRPTCVEGSRMLKDFTRNLFYFFRGPSPDDKSVRDRQLENNLTKSLIVVLEHADNDVFLQVLVRKLGLAPADPSLRFSLQRKPVGVQTTVRKVVLGITGGMHEPIDTRGTADGGRPDAWILTDQWAVLVESKIGYRIADDQLHRHAKSAGWALGSYEVLHLTWQDIYALFRHELAKLGDRDFPTSRLLVGQWLDYLRGQQMIPFERLESDDFDYFNLPKDEQRQLMAHIHQRLEEFQQRLAHTEPAVRILKCCGLTQGERWKQWTQRAGERQAWFNVGGASSARNWHATVFFRPHGVDVEVLGAGRDVTRRFAKAGVERVTGLVRLCVESSEDPSIAIGCRRAWYADPESGYKGQRIDHTDEPLMAHPRILAESTRDQFAVVLLGLLANSDPRYRTELIIRYSIPREAITHGDLAAQVRLVADALSRIQGPLEFLLAT